MKRLNTKSRIVNLKKTKNHPNTYLIHIFDTYINKKHVYLQVKVADSFREKMTQNPSTASNSKVSVFGHKATCVFEPVFPAFLIT